MKIGVFGNDYLKDKVNPIRRLFEKLQQLEAEVYIDAPFYHYISHALSYEPPVAGLIHGDVFALDIALSVGGDGTFLRTAARVNCQNIPIVGINTGRLGFLADISSNDIEDMLDALFKNYYKIEERTLLKLHTQRRAYKGYNYALNEIAIMKRDTSSMITIHTTIDDQYLTSYQSDGLVIATPTGSTAYSMSVNGPILVPQSNSIVLSPIAPHSLNVRPLVIPDSCVITLHVESRSDNYLVALDGRSEVFPHDIELKICRADYCAKVIKRHNHTFYETLREKLMWGADSRRKE